MNLVKLGTIVKIYKGKKANLVPRENSNDVLRFIQIDDLRNNNNLKFTDSKGVHVTPNDIIIAWDGANAGTIGYGLSGVIGSTLAKLELQTENILPGYLGRFLKSKSKYLRDKCTGATIPHISGQVLVNLQIPVLPIDKQKKILDVLDEADSLRQKRKQAIRLIDEYIRSVFLEMFGDPKLNPKKFSFTKLKDVYIDPKNGTKCGPFGSALKKDELVSNGVPVWNMDNISLSGKMVMPFRMWITPEKFQKLRSYAVLNGDVIISRAGTVGKMCVVETDEQSIISTNLIRVRFCSRLLPIYFVSLMNNFKGRIGRLKTGPDGSFTHMNTGVLDNLTFPLPPIDLQNKFAKMAVDAEILKEKMLEQSQELDNQFQSLIQKSFMID